MKKLRQHFLEIKEGFLDAKIKSSEPAIKLAYIFFVGIIYLLVCYSSMILIAFNLTYVWFCIVFISMLLLIIFYYCPSVSLWASSFSTDLLYKVFGKYGRVVTKEDWKIIKKKSPGLYKFLHTKKEYLGKCYYCSWAIACFLKDAQLMYGSYKVTDGSFSGHAVIVKNNCVYDTNHRMHHDIDEYKELFSFEVYKIFSEKDYRTKDFFDNIRNDFVKWCSERNSYCKPQ